MGSGGAYAGSWQRAVSVQEVRVLAREDVVRDGGDGVVVAQALAEGEHEGRLARSYRSATPHVNHSVSYPSNSACASGAPHPAEFCTPFCDFDTDSSMLFNCT